MTKKEKSGRVDRFTWVPGDLRPVDPTPTIRGRLARIIKARRKKAGKE